MVRLFEHMALIASLFAGLLLYPTRFVALRARSKQG